MVLVLHPPEPKRVYFHECAPSWRRPFFVNESQILHDRAGRGEVGIPVIAVRSVPRPVPCQESRGQEAEGFLGSSVDVVGPL